MGAVYPLSGAVTRRVIRDSIEFYFENEINAVGGIESLGGAKVTVVWGDSQAKADIAMAETERLITQEGCVMIFGGWWSSLTYAIQEVCQRYKVPNVCVSSSSPTLLERDYEYFFMAWPHDDYFAMKEVDFLIEELERQGISDKVKTVGVFVESALFGQTARSSWIKYIDKANDEGRVDWEIVMDITFPAPVTDVTSEVLKLKQADPDLVFMCPMAPADCVKVMTVMIEQDYYPPIAMTMDAGFAMWDFWQIEEMRKGCKFFYSRFGAGMLEDQIVVVPKLKSLYDEWNSEFDYWDNGAFAYYVAAIVAKDALELAGQKDPGMEDFTEALKDALYELSIPQERIGLYGVDFDEDTGYNNLVEIIIGQNRDDPDNPGDVIWRTVWPYNLAVEESIIPDPRSRGLD